MFLQKTILGLGFIVILSLHTRAQWYKPEKISKKVSVKYGLALQEVMQRKNYTAALKLLDECLVLSPDFVDGWLSKAGVYAELKQYSLSADHYKKAYDLDSVYCKPFLLPYAISLAGAGKFTEALQKVEQYLQLPGLNERSMKAAQYRKSCFSFAVAFAQKHPSVYYEFRPHNLGDSINSAASEYFPSLTVDGKTMVFTRLVNNTNEDFFISEKINGTWTKATKLPGDLNTADNEGAQNISQDGRMLVFTGCNMEDGEGSCDIYFSYRNKNGEWGRRINAGPNINTEYWESQPCLSPDKKALYFTARDPSGFGGSDIYVSYLQPNGRWSKPFNLGAHINTKGDESSPFLHADNQTLYFTSNGHTGYGGTDLFVARRQPDGSWGKPENLGYPINTIDDEGSLIVTADGTTAYYASNRSEGKGGLDIYTFSMPAHAQPYKTLWVKGRVFDLKTGNGLPSLVELTTTTEKYRLSEVQTDEEGQYLITLPVGKDYVFNVNRKGYLFYSGNFYFSKNQPDSIFTLDIPLTPIEANATMVLKNILFETGKYNLEPVSTIELDKLVTLLNENPGLIIEIGGHTDNVGKPQDNLLLSENRAKAVREYLLQKGIAATRIRTKGYGATQPLSDNNTEEGRAQNRRTEIKIIATNN